jgi:guanylate kinase
MTMLVAGVRELPGQLVVVSGPSGCGKSTIIRRALAHPELNIELSVSATTRQPRPGERNGVDYHFMEEEEFLARRDRNEFLEYTEYNLKFYGTLAAPVYDALASKKTVLLEIEVEGATQIRRKVPETFFVFIKTPSFRILGERLRNRGTEAEADIFRRLVRAREELDEAHWYDCEIINDDLDRCVEEFISVLKSCGSGG